MNMDAFARGFDAGNYANAYTSTDLETAWEVMEDPEKDPVNLSSSSPDTLEAFRAGYVLGFFSSYENDEIDSDYLEEFVIARETWGARARAYGIAID